jgi:broad specificity phosphatase PhoE
MQTLWLVRHEHRLDFICPEWFETAIYPYDPPLSIEGSDRAVRLAEKFSKMPIERIYTSPFLRTIQTAHPLAKLLNLPIWLEWGLCEWLCRDWTSELPETTPVDKLMQCYPNVDVAYQSLVTPCYPETVEELDARLHNIAYKLIHDNCENMLIVAHKGSAVGIVAALTGNSDWLTYDLPCGGTIELVSDRGRWFSSIIER